MANAPPRQFLRRENDPGGVVRGVDQDQPGPRRDRRPQGVEVGAEVRAGHRDATRLPGQGDTGGVDVEPRLEDDDLVALVDQGEQGRLDDLGRARADDDLVAGSTSRP